LTIFLDDISLLKKIQTGSKESFDILFKKYYTPLCRYAVQFVKDNSIAEESTVSDEKYFYEIAIAINKAIVELPNKCREIFVLSREKNLTYKQISEELNISIKAVENQQLYLAHLFSNF
jgi:DNA-directed RNA polymerase specialized sigma24 family protein